MYILTYVPGRGAWRSGSGSPPPRPPPGETPNNGSSTIMIINGKITMNMKYD